MIVLSILVKIRKDGDFIIVGEINGHVGNIAEDTENQHGSYADRVRNKEEDN